MGRTKDQIRTKEQVNAAMAACKALKLDGLVIVGGMHELWLYMIVIDIQFFLFSYLLIPRFCF